jgi:hypothetical protein
MRICVDCKRREVARHPYGTLCAKCSDYAKNSESRADNRWRLVMTVVVTGPFVVALVAISALAIAKLCGF